MTRSTFRWMCHAVCRVALSAVFATAAMPVYAGPGHDHGDDMPVPVNGNGPKRLPDGSVFLPKPAQRQLGVLTLPAGADELSRVTELAGTAVMDPNAGGLVQPTLAGRIEAGPQGLPAVGQRVRKGEVLAYVMPSAGALERSSQTAQLAELRAAKTLADKRLVRLKELADTVPRKDIEAMESEAASLAARIAAIGAGLSGREALAAPVSGVIASANAVAGQVEDARELLFEVVDPERLFIEALAYDAALVADISAAYVMVDAARVPLRYVGAARSLRGQALPVMFAAEGAALSGLAVGQPVRVYVQGGGKISGMRIPAEALVRDPANQTIVWVKRAPEHFEPHAVVVEPLDGASVAVISGLHEHDRVVVRAASLVNQVR